jgi:hypothetical protein
MPARQAGADVLTVSALLGHAYGRRGARQDHEIRIQAAAAGVGVPLHDVTDQ